MKRKYPRLQCAEDVQGPGAPRPALCQVILTYRGHTRPFAPGDRVPSGTTDDFGWKLDIPAGATGLVISVTEVFSPRTPPPMDRCTHVRVDCNAAFAQDPPQ